MKLLPKLIINCDGGARGNPGSAAIGVVIQSGGREVAAYGTKIGETTNNTAEYQAVLSAFTYLVNRKIRGSVVQVKLDSLLVVQQLSGIYKIKKNHLRQLAVQIKKLEPEIGEQVLFRHIPRSENKQADFLVNQALDTV